MNFEKMFGPGMESKASREKRWAGQREQQSRFSQEVHRWLPRLLLAIPLAAGCSQERVAKWAEQAFSGPATVERVSSTSSKSPRAFIDTEKGNLIPQEVKREITQTLKKKPKPVFVEPAEKEETRPTVSRKEILPPTAHKQHTRADQEQISHHEYTTPAESRHDGPRLEPQEPRHDRHEHANVFENHNFSFSRQPHGHSSEKGHPHFETGHGRAISSPHLHEGEYEHSEGSLIDEKRGYVNLPILAGKGAISIEFQRARADEDPSKERFDGEVSLASEPIFAGIQPGGRIRITDKGSQYTMSVSIMPLEKLPFGAEVNVYVGGDGEIDQHVHGVVEQYEAMFGGLTNILEKNGSHHHDEEEHEDQSSRPQTEITLKSPIGSVRLKQGGFEAHTAGGRVEMDASEGKVEFSPGTNEPVTLGVRGQQVYIVPEVSISLGRDREPIHLGGLLTSDLEGNNKGVFVRLSKMF